jgi:hypothetical protein
MPFTGANWQALDTAPLLQTPVPPSQLNTKVPAGVDRAILTALAREPNARYRTAGAFALAIEAGARISPLRPPPLWLSAIVVTSLLAPTLFVVFLPFQEFRIRGWDRAETWLLLGLFNATMVGFLFGPIIGLVQLNRRRRAGVRAAAWTLLYLWAGWAIAWSAGFVYRLENGNLPTRQEPTTWLAYVATLISIASIPAAWLYLVGNRPVSRLPNAPGRWLRGLAARRRFALYGWHALFAVSLIIAATVAGTALGVVSALVLWRERPGVTLK